MSSHLWIKRHLNPWEGRRVKSFPNACLLLSGPKVAKPLVQVPGTGIQATPSNTSFEGQGRHTGPVYLETHGSDTRPQPWWPRSLTQISALSSGALVILRIDRRMEQLPMSLHWHFPGCPRQFNVFYTLQDTFLPHRSSWEQELVGHFLRYMFWLLLFILLPAFPSIHPPTHLGMELGWTSVLCASLAKSLWHSHTCSCFLSPRD